MDPTKEPERRAIRRVAELYEARELHRAVLAKPMKVADNAVTERFAGRPRTKLGDVLVMLGAMGGELEEDLASVAGGFHPEIYLAELCQRDQRRKRQQRYARTDLVLTPPKRPYSRQELPRVAAGLQELRLLDRDKAYRRALRAVRTLRFYPDRGSRGTEFDVRHALAAIWRSKGRYSAAAAALSKAFRLAGSDHRLRARGYHGLASLARDLGELDVGLEAAIRAGKASLVILDVHGLGRSLITRGQMHVYRGDLDLGLVSLKTSIPMVEDDVWYWRYAGFQNLAFCRLYRDELGEARASASDALTAVDGKLGKAPLQLSTGLWLRGEILLRMGLAAESTKDIEGVLEVYVANRFRPLDIALIGIRLAHVYHLTGDSRSLAELARRLIPVAARMETNDELTKASFDEFLCQAKRGFISADLLDRIYRKVLGGAGETPPMAQLAVMPPGSYSGPVASQAVADADSAATTRTKTRT